MLVFNEEEHKYLLDGKELISVTTLMKKHGLSPDYSAVDPVVLRRKAMRGTLIHKELEDYLIGGESGFTKELYAFIEIEKRFEIKNATPEQKVHNDIVAGTVDLQAEYKGGTLLADFKTTAKVHIEPVRWQMSIYQELIGKKFDTLAVIHLDGNKAEFIPVEPIEEKLVKELFEAERNGKIFKENK